MDLTRPKTSLAGRFAAFRFGEVSADTGWIDRAGTSTGELINNPVSDDRHQADAKDFLECWDYVHLASLLLP
jgi:hypothetical protein